MNRLLALAFLLLSDLALAAPYRQTSGGGCCSLIFIILFTAIYRSGGADWARSIGAAAIPGVFGWFIWRDRELGTGSRWCALVCAILQALGFVLGLVLTALLYAGAFNGLLNLGPAGKDGKGAPTAPAIDLSKIPEDESLGLHPVCTIVSDPPGAKVFVNGKERGTTPLDTKLAAGQPNEVKVELAGYFPATQSKAPNARENLTFSFTLMAAARLKVTSTPPGARVLAGMKEVLPRTPGFSAPIELGETEVLVLLDGYQAHRQKLTLPSGDTELEVSLEPGVKLAVTSTPDQAEIFVDGAWSGLTPASVFVAPKGKHVVEVKKETWAPVKKVFASIAKPTSFDAKLVDTGRVRAQQAVAKARARYDKVNHELEKVQVQLERMYTPSPSLERKRQALDAEMEKAAGVLEKAEAQLKAVEEERGVVPPPRDTEPE